MTCYPHKGRDITLHKQFTVYVTSFNWRKVVNQKPQLLRTEWTFVTWTGIKEGSLALYAHEHTYYIFSEQLGFVFLPSFTVEW